MAIKQELMAIYDKRMVQVPEGHVRSCKVKLKGDWKQSCVLISDTSISFDRLFWLECRFWFFLSKDESTCQKLKFHFLSLIFGLKHKKYIFQIQTKNYGFRFYGSIPPIVQTGWWRPLADGVPMYMRMLVEDSEEMVVLRSGSDTLVVGI